MEISHFNGFTAVEVPGSSYSFAEKSGGLNSDRTALIHYVSCGAVADSGQIILDGVFHYALSRDHWQTYMAATPNDAALLRSLALAAVGDDAEAAISGQDVQGFNPAKSGGAHVSPRYLSPP
jgi:hypothetical protein